MNYLTALVTALLGNFVISFSSLNSRTNVRSTVLMSSPDPCPLSPGSSILIVGGNRGLGLELCKSTSVGGLKTFGTTRKSNPEMESLAKSSKEFTIIPDIEMEDDNVGNNIASKLPKIKLDYVLLVAGYFTTETLDELNFSEQRKMMEICAFAPLRVVQQLIKSGHIAEGTKIGMVTSEGGSIGLRTLEEGGGNYGHHMSKCAQNMMGKILAIDIYPKGIPLVMVHPGFLRTEMTKHYAQFYEQFGAVTADVAVEPILSAVNKVSRKKLVKNSCANSYPTY